MTNFRVGDRVRVTYRNFDYSLRPGDTGVVTSAGASVVSVRKDGSSVSGAIRTTRIEKLVEREPGFSKGDRVRVTFEAEYGCPGDEAHHFGILNSVRKDADNLSIVKVADPIKPGDFVREKSTDRVFFIAANGYAQVTPTTGPFFEYEPDGIEYSFPNDTGEYERVEVEL